MKQQLLTATALLASAAALAQTGGGLLAFPGAEGFGRFATGGRGGTIYHVTSLADAGAGTLRDAVSAEGRIVVFDVSGIIRLESALVFKGNNTILGQTAPGEGVQVYGNRISFSDASNLIVRHMRFRMGINGESGKDACGVANGTNMIFDHLSVLWGRDENFSVSWDNKNTKPGNITIQNSIIGQGLQTHSCGGLIQTDGGVTLYRNLYIENKTRNPKVKGLNQYVNNVVYNWGDGGCYIMGDSEGDTWAHIEGNYFIKGPWNNSTRPFTRGTQTFRFYAAGNMYDDDKDGSLNGHAMTVEEQIGRQSGTAGDGSDDQFSTYIASLETLNADTLVPQPIPPINEIMSAEAAYAWMLQNVGPTLPVRDEVDQYLIDELASYGTSGTKNGISSELQLAHKGTGTLSGGQLPTDTDHDGIPDAWETANGLNPNDATDAAAIAANGYANIENYANSLTGPYPYLKVPTKFAVDSLSTDSVRLSWQLNTNLTRGFLVELAAGHDDYREAARLEAGTTSCLLTGLTADRTSYKVRLCAYSDDGLKSDYVKATFGAAATADTDDPATPSGDEPQGDVLFYTDFHTTPQAWADKYGDVTANTNIVNAANTSVTLGGMSIGSGENSLRILNMPGCQSDNASSDYGPYTEADAGASPYCIQFYTEKAGGYVQLPQVSGPCTITIYAGNTSASQRTIRLLTTTPAGESAKSLVLANSKRMFKFTYTVADSAAVSFKIDANAKKVNVNDILIERYTPGESPTPLATVASDALRVIAWQGALRILGLQAGDAVSIADLGGRLVSRFTAQADGSASVGAPKGVYIVSVNGRGHTVRLY